MRKRLQNRVAESRFAFPIASLYALAIWMFAGAVADRLYVQLALFALSTLMMVYINNSNALIRIYSRMVSCSFIVMTCAVAFVFSSVECAVVQAGFVMFYLSLFRCYQDKRSPGIAYYSFLCLGIVSLFFVHILYFVPFFWVLMGSNLMSMNIKMLLASLLGLITPYWFAVGYCFYIGQPEWMLEHFVQLGEFQSVSCIETVDIHRIVTFAVFLLMAIIGMVHFMRNSYLDKIRTRMIFEMFITVDLLVIVFMVLQPQHYDMLLPLMIVNTSCLYAHFISLTKTRLTNITFIVIGLALLSLTVYNLLA